MAVWMNHELDLLAELPELGIAPRDPNGFAFVSATTIWSVLIDKDLFVRSYRGVTGRWYRLALAQRTGRITIGSLIVDVDFAPADPALQDRIDTAYRAKYPHSVYLAPMLAAGAREARPCTSLAGRCAYPRLDEARPQKRAVAARRSPRRPTGAPPNLR